MSSHPVARVFALVPLLILTVLLSACITRTERAPSPTTEPDPSPTPEITATAETEDDKIEEVVEPDELGKPVRFEIDRIDVDADVEHVEKDDEGRMDVPQEWENVAWFELGPRPGEQGNAVIAGHYDSFNGPAVFYKLGELELGDIVRVMTEEDDELEFEVIEIELVHIDDADSQKIFGETDSYNLNLVTCEGEWDLETDMYDHRLILYTELIDT